MSNKNPSEETITLNLVFGDGEEEIEITMEQYLMIQDMANQSNMSFEEKFVELITKAAQEVLEDKNE